ncbi:polysaccharide pyruvyl transferase family protein [Pectobacterium odoriferum]|uniref:polysaccharide pyruvyl transferase family protein n=1 Tax=Pectobacterium odoriferum TaxID=78398 RepID=UPI000CCFF22C|nr:polysaccharide pyruvyl transferase family protein [Pectobacterium odoriferum]POE02265.1 hypothetical protein BV916_15935 [Pectobacterium odoriferum]
MSTNSILVFDTSIASLNIGDQIIMDAVYGIISSLFPYSQIFNSSTHDIIGKQTYKLNRLSQYSFVGGSNLLSSDHRFAFKRNKNQWAVDIRDSRRLNNVILLGAGWKSYQSIPSFLTKFLYSKLLSGRYSHAVRDNYTYNMLRNIGIDNVINTGCPTMWGLDAEHCSQIPTHKSEDVVFTLTDYSKDIRNDTFLIEFLRNSYEKIYFWPQGSGDLKYLSSLPSEGINILKPSLQAYDEILEKNVDFIGTRLHAGIRALQKKKRAIIISIDNRAKEIGKDTNLFTLDRLNIEALQDVINSSLESKISIRENDIFKWKSQFSNK